MPFYQRLFAPILAFVCTATLLVPRASGAAVSTIAGTGIKGFAGDGGPAREAQLNNPFGVARGPDGALYVCDMDNHRIRRIGPDGIIRTFAGSARRGFSGDGGPAAAAALDQPYDMAWDGDGNLYFVELGNHAVRRVALADGTISTVAGDGQPGFTGDGGPARNARFRQPHSLAFDRAGNLYVCDILNYRIRRIDARTGLISTWAGTGEKKTAPDGSPITGSALNGPRALVFGPDGKGWLALREGNSVLQLDPDTNRLWRVAGTGASGFAGNGGPALAAALSGPKGVSLSATGRLYLADTESHSIRYLDLSTKTIELLVGNGQRGDGPDGEPLSCQLARPHGVWAERDGSVVIGDSENHRVRLWRR